MWGKDIVVIAVNATNECRVLTDDGTSGDSGLSTVMYLLPVMHMSAYMLGIFAAVAGWREGLRVGRLLHTILCPGCVGVVMSIYCFVMWAEIDSNGVNADSCYWVIVAWPWLEGLALLCVCCYAMNTDS